VARKQSVRRVGVRETGKEKRKDVRVGRGDSKENRWRSICACVCRRESWLGVNVNGQKDQWKRMRAGGISGGCWRLSWDEGEMGEASGHTVYKATEVDRRRRGGGGRGDRRIQLQSEVMSTRRRSERTAPEQKCMSTILVCTSECDRIGPTAMVLDLDQPKGCHTAETDACSAWGTNANGPCTGQWRFQYVFLVVDVRTRSVFIFYKLRVLFPGQTWCLQKGYVVKREVWT